MLWRLGRVTVIKRAPESQVIVIKSKVGAARMRTCQFVIALYSEMLHVHFLVDEAGVEVVEKLSCPEGRRKAAAANTPVKLE